MDKKHLELIEYKKTSYINKIRKDKKVDNSERCKMNGKGQAPEAGSSRKLQMACIYHPNKELRKKEHRKIYHCDGCKMNGTGVGYTCDKCDYVLHSQCAFPAKQITPSFLQGYLFDFKKVPPPTSGPTRKRYCDACGVEAKGFVYHCPANRYDLHPRCASLHKRVKIDGQKLVFMKESAPKKCDLCDDSLCKSVIKSIRTGWFYASESDADCKCHVFCIMNMGSNKDGSAIAKLESLPLVKKKRDGQNGHIYWNFLKAIVTYVLAAVLGDPTTIGAKFVVDGGLQLLDLFFRS